MTDIPLFQNLYQEEIYRIKPKVLIVINKPWSEVSEEEITLLEKILKALKLSLASVQIAVRSQFSVEDFMAFSSKFIIAFGSSLKNSEKLYEGIQIDGTTIVAAHALDELDEGRKRNLWLTLKQVFQS
jgi:hypothetical protein